MNPLFSADDVFEIAQTIEVNGGIFYRKAAELIDEETPKAIMLKLAAMEDEHERFFAGLREQLKRSDGEPWAVDPDGEASRYLQAFTDGNVFDTKRELPANITGTASVEDILRTAIGFEKDAIVFFLGIRNYVPESLGKKEVDKIIEEEQRHIVILTTELNARRKQTASSTG
ncbi:MAG: ferritin family protein [Myxococcota bacterium]|nr:ferritin family protein [Myxococcota bacterium]